MFDHMDHIAGAKIYGGYVEIRASHGLGKLDQYSLLMKEISKVIEVLGCAPSSIDFTYPPKSLGGCVQWRAYFDKEDLKEYVERNIARLEEKEKDNAEDNN